MPTASANISAKFIAQIVIPVRRVPSHSAPAVATSPAIESSSGMPAAGKRAERDEEHRERERPGHDLGAHHRGLVLLVELRPERRRAGDRQLDAGRGEALEPVVHAARRADHLGRVRARPAPHHGHAPVRRDGPATARQAHIGHGRLAPQHPCAALDGAPERRVAGGVAGRAYDHGQRIAAMAGEMAVDQLPRANGLRAVCLPTAARQRLLGTRRDDAERNDQDGPRDEDEPPATGRPKTKTTERSEGPADGGGGRRGHGRPRYAGFLPETFRGARLPLGRVAPRSVEGLGCRAPTGRACSGGTRPRGARALDREGESMSGHLLAAPKRVRLRLLWVGVAVLLLAALLPGQASAQGNACENRNNNTYDKLLGCVTLEGVREHQAAFQAIADANDDPFYPGTRAAGTEGYANSVEYVARAAEAGRLRR